jgi:ABC-type transport system substrate-binding protein
VIEQANPDYFRGAPRLDRLIIAPATSRQSALNQAINDAGTLLPPSLDLNTMALSALNGTRLSSDVYSRTFAWTHLDLIEHGALADSRVRRALALATPRDQIIRQVLHGHGQLSDGDQAPGTAAYEPTVKNFYRFDLGAARRLLALAGYGPVTWKAGHVNIQPSAGVTLTINLWADSSCTTCAPTLGLIARGWAQAGISSRIHLVPTGFLFGPNGPLYNIGRFQAPEYNAVLYAWVNGPDPDDSTYWSQSAIVTPTNLLAGNFGGYHNAAVDYLATRALVTPNGPSRYSYYRRIQRILAADEPDIFLYWADSRSIVPKRLVGYSTNPYNPAATWNVASWYMTG